MSQSAENVKLLVIQKTDDVKYDNVEKSKTDAEEDKEETADTKGQKRQLPESSDSSEAKPATPTSPDVHSANKWEEVDLGDEERKHKFLKLMGAEKGTHSGKIVIGESQQDGMKRTASSADRLNTQLEEQYLHSLEHKLQGPRRHGGLGFHDQANPPPPQASAEKTAQDQTEKKDEKPAEGEGDKAPKEEVKSPLDKYKKMSFVKSSS